jgi:D-3-phosphoglycerate dehydrogenase / 2-oxoglutarate reductase
MKVIAYDPFLSEERATRYGREKVELDLLARADFITLHVPLTDKTRNILSAENIAKTQAGRAHHQLRARRAGGRGGAGRGAEIRPCRRCRALMCSKWNPPPKARFSTCPMSSCTPHLGASTTEAQENVALQVAEQMADYLLTGAVQNALNMPSVTAEEARVMGPWLKLAGHLGNFVGQMTDEPIKAINILYDGKVAEMNLEALNCGAIAGIMKPPTPM